MTERLIVELPVHVREDGSTRLHTRDALERVREMGMGRMRRSPVAIDDPGLDTLERRERGIVQPDEVGRVSETAKAKAKAGGEAVVLGEGHHSHPGHLERALDQ